MANNCEYELRIQGAKKDCEAFKDVIQYKNEKEKFSRIFSADLINEDGDDESHRMTFAGDCAWSAASSFEAPHSDDKTQISLADACGKHHLEAEIWTAEPGCEFAEHFQFDENGDEIFSECYGYKEEYNEEKDDYKVTEKPEDFWEFNIF